MLLADATHHIDFASKDPSSISELFETGGEGIVDCIVLEAFCLALPIVPFDNSFLIQTLAHCRSNDRSRVVVVWV